MRPVAEIRADLLEGCDYIHNLEELLDELEEAAYIRGRKAILLMLENFVAENRLDDEPNQ